MQPRYNAAPSQLLPVILNADPAHIVFSHWGIAPAWLSHVARKDGLINVRFENLRDRPTFKKDLALRRCLVLADGFYEWKSVPKRKFKIPYRITRKDSAPFAFAGIWEDGADAVPPRFAIITTAADKFMQPIHSRMPVILDRDEEREWVSGSGDVPVLGSFPLIENNAAARDMLHRSISPLLGLLKTPYASPLRAYEVSREVNRAAVDEPSLIEPVDGSQDERPLLLR